MSLSEVVLDAAALRQNFETLRRWYGERPLFPVVKANAYGHGAELICAELEANFDNKALPYFCVARYGEAERLRSSGVRRPLLVLSHFTASEIISNPLSDVDLVVSDPRADLAEIASLPPAVRSLFGTHLKFDSGMNRLGLGLGLKGEDADVKAVAELLDALRKLGVPVRGFMTHLARGEDLPSIFSQRQMTVFERVVRRLRGAWSVENWGEFPAWIHAANSSGIERAVGSAVCNAARPGLHLWGVAANGTERLRLEKEGKLMDLRPVLEAQAPIRQLRIVKEGEGVGYGHRYVARGERLIGVAAFGYADGVFRQASRGANEAWKVGFEVAGHRVPVAGTVSMDLTMLDLTEHPQSAAWKSALRSGNRPQLVAGWISRQQPVETHADAFGTITYEILCALTSRLPRRWVQR